MTKNERYDAYGKVCLNSAVVVQLSWIPTLAILDGAAWASPNAAGYSHMAALAFIVAAPLVVGARLLRSEPREPGAMKDWALLCLLPPVGCAVGIQLVLRLASHVTIPLVAGLMLATVPLGVYGVLLRRE